VEDHDVPEGRVRRGQGIERVDENRPVHLGLAGEVVVGYVGAEEQVGGPAPGQGVVGGGAVREIDGDVRCARHRRFRPA
jgi:hypothetical protein